MWLERWEAAIQRSATAIEDDLSAYNGDLSIAQIGLGAALGYLDFRLPDIDWRSGRSSVSDWFRSFASRPAMRETDPETA